MSVRTTIQKTFSMGGVSFAETITKTADAFLAQEVSVPAAQESALSTRTNNTDGTLTMDSSGHSITTGSRVDLYWTVAGVSGERLGATVGTVSGASVPFTGGSGDNLPAQASVIMAALPEVLDIIVDGDNVAAILLASAKRGQIVFTSSGVTEQFAKTLGAATSFAWHDTDGSVNPIVGDDIVAVYVSHGDAAAATMKVGVLFNN